MTQHSVTPPVVLSPVSPLAGRSVFVSGGTGSFGQAFVRRALDDGARRVVVFSRDELKQATMRAAFNDAARLRFFVGDIRDPHRLALAMQGCEIVVHAAAMKRIETCESDPGEAVATNIIGTQNVAMAAIAARVERAVFLSTDKAPNAHTLYGMTKAVAERLWIQSNVFAAGGVTKLSATRYGNVLGSRGSVLDLFRKQAAAGEQITITDARATRFWMSLDQSVDLVTLALREMRGGEIFIPKAPSALVTRLAAAVAGEDQWWREIGLRPGERLHETLISPEEARTTRDAGTHYVIESESQTWRDETPANHPLVLPGFCYRSDTNPDQMTVERLREMVAA